MTAELEPVWRYEIKYGPEGEANYAWLYKGDEMVATMKTHHAIALSSAQEAIDKREERIRELEAGFEQMKADHACEVADMATRFRAVNVERLSEQLGADVFALRDRAEAAEARVKELEAGIRRLSDEEELCDEMNGEDPFSIVRLAAKLADCEARNRKIMSSLKNVVMLGDVGHYVNDAVFDELMARAHRAEAGEARLSALQALLDEVGEVIEPFAGYVVPDADPNSVSGERFGTKPDLKAFRAARSLAAKIKGAKGPACGQTVDNP